MVSRAERRMVEGLYYFIVTFNSSFSHLHFIAGLRRARLDKERWLSLVSAKTGNGDIRSRKATLGQV